MQRYAIVTDNVVTNVTRATSPLADNWVASDTAGIGDQYDPNEGTFTRPAAPAPSIEELRAEALSRINAEYSARASVLAGDYPAAEQQSWPMQVTEAAAVLADDSAPTPWIDAAAPARGITREALAALIQAQDTAYRSYHGAITGTRQALRDAIAAVPDDENAAAALDAIQWPE